MLGRNWVIHHVHYGSRSHTKLLTTSKSLTTRTKHKYKPNKPNNPNNTNHPNKPNNPNNTNNNADNPNELSTSHCSLKTLSISFRTNNPINLVPYTCLSLKIQGY